MANRRTLLHVVLSELIALDGIGVEKSKRDYSHDCYRHDCLPYFLTAQGHFDSVGHAGFLIVCH